MQLLLREYKKYFIESLYPLYEIEEIESFFYLLLEEFHGMKRVDLALNPFFVINNEQKKVWENALDDLKKEKPIQYIIGKTEFYGLLFNVNQNTLIPRPETEELVEWVIHSVNERCETKKELPVKILDIGTGSGCIAVSLAKNLLNAEVYALDISNHALEVAKSNARLNGVNITFIEQDILQTQYLKQQFDVIVSNPPYVRYLEKEEMKKNVLNYEPSLALFVEDNDALLFYKKITSIAQENLFNDGLLFFEINQYLGDEMVKLLESFKFNPVELKKDIYGNHRMMKANK